MGVGTSEELLATNEIYREVYESQVKGGEDDEQKTKGFKRKFTDRKAAFKICDRNVQGSVCDRIYLYFVKFDRINFGIIVPQVFNR